MPQLFQTRDREGAVRELAQRFDRVLVRNKNLLWNPLRLRRSQIADLTPFIVLNPPEFDRELEGWNREGGVLIYDRSYVALENIGAHPAQLLSECPVSRADLERFTEGTSDVVVAYRPPNWDEHQRWIAHVFPDAELCQRFYELVAAQPPATDAPAMLGLESGFRMLGDQVATDALGVRTAELHCIRRAMLPPRAFKAIWQVSPRIEPTDRTLADVYRYIDEECPDVAGVRLVVPSEISKRVRFWKVALYNLQRRGAIAIRDTLYCYQLGEVVPHWERLAARRRNAGDHLAEMIQLLEAAPEFNQPRARTPRRSLSRARLSRSTSPA